MKKRLVLLFSILILPFSANASDVYYCSDDGHIGFETTENFKMVNYSPKRFKILIDFENKNVISEDIWFIKNNKEYTRCVNYMTDELYCINDLGAVFSFNQENLKFIRGSITNLVNVIDDPTLAHGTCEKF